MNNTTNNNTVAPEWTHRCADEARAARFWGGLFGIVMLSLLAGIVLAGLWVITDVWSANSRPQTYRVEDPQ